MVTSARPPDRPTACPPAHGPVRHAVTREIWGDEDTVLLIFAGAAAEFALNRAVDWLFFTDALPRDPVGRLFRTVRYAQTIAFATPSEAYQTLQRIRRIHDSVERARGEAIPAWAYRAVLYMLIDYSERAAHLLTGPLGYTRQEELYADFRRIGEGLGTLGLPHRRAEWLTDRDRRLKEDLAWSPHTAALYAAYRRHLGPWRYQLLRQFQSVLVPPYVAELLRLPTPPVRSRLLQMWRALRAVGLAPLVRQLVVPTHESESTAPPRHIEANVERGSHS
jgi:uncharacterized protein (DUF2236 family)